LSGTRATRTTHPHSLKLLEGFLELVRANDITIDNPFIWKTKAEVIRLLDPPGDKKLIAQSLSCSRTREIKKRCIRIVAPAPSAYSGV
jgi:hypothetical protein